MLDPNNDFNAPCYDDTFRRNYVFDEEFGNVEHYFIELDYYIMREAYKSRRKQPLDLDIKYFDDGGDGEPIFRDVSEEEKSLLETRGYVVLEEHIDIGASDFGDIYHVTEVYGYEPKDANGNPFEFVKYESMLVNSHGWVKIDGTEFGDKYEKADFDIKTGHLRVIFTKDNPLFVGDTLILKKSWAKTPNLTGSSIGAKCLFQPTSVSWVSTELKDGIDEIHCAYVPVTSGTLIPDESAPTSLDSGFFYYHATTPNGWYKVGDFKVTKGGAMSVVRPHRKRSSSQILTLVKKITTLSIKEPILEESHKPRNLDGTIAEEFSHLTTPSVEEHLTKLKENAYVRI
ncbi:MAG: hypothetical protein E7035_07410, partial [Verrucomicrobiaceae bacterium]|nr:hypothetical protein [Verrucomicrobiaceae bacterium]